MRLGGTETQNTNGSAFRIRVSKCDIHAILLMYPFSNLIMLFTESISYMNNFE